MPPTLFVNNSQTSSYKWIKASQENHVVSLKPLCMPKYDRDIQRLCKAIKHHADRIHEQGRNRVTDTDWMVICTMPPTQPFWHSQIRQQQNNDETVSLGQRRKQGWTSRSSLCFSKGRTEWFVEIDTETFSESSWISLHTMIGILCGYYYWVLPKFPTSATRSQICFQTARSIENFHAKPRMTFAFWRSSDRQMSRTDSFGHVLLISNPDFRCAECCGCRIMAMSTYAQRHKLHVFKWRWHDVFRFRFGPPPV